MVDKKQLVLAVEGTSILGPYWGTIVTDYLKKLLRSFCGYEATEAASPNVELSLVQFNAHGTDSSCLVKPGDWTTNMDCFFYWLSGIHFSGGGFCDAAIAEGLAEVLMMFPSPNGDQSQQNGGLQRHCILVAASNPYSDAETISKSFPRCFVSLSVICPMQHPKLKEIYIAGKSNPLAADHTIKIVTNPHYLVLISENFTAACADLSQSGITILPSTSVSPVNEIWHPVPNVPTVSCATTQEGSSLQTCSPLSTSQEMISSNDNLKPFVSRPTNASILNKLSNAHLKNMKDVVQSVMMPPPRMSQQGKTANAMQSSQPDYVKLWEGDLTCLQKGQPVVITKLQGYRYATASALLSDDWPPTMLINRLISQDHMNNKQYTGEAEFIAFVARNEHVFLGNMQQNKLWAVIQLPSQTLLLSVSDNANRLIGWLFPGDMVVFQPQPSEHHPPPPSQLQQQGVALVGQGQVSSPGPKA